MAGIDLHAMALLEVGRHRLAQLGDAVGGRVAVMAVAQRLAGRFHDMLGRLEVGLADAEIDDVLALGLQGLGAGEHLEGGSRCPGGRARRQAVA